MYIPIRCEGVRVGYRFGGEGVKSPLDTNPFPVLYLQVDGPFRNVTTSSDRVRPAPTATPTFRNVMCNFYTIESIQF